MHKKKTLIGTVLSNRMNKTIVVVVKRLYKHPKYKKYINKMKKYKVHDEFNNAKVGDVIEMIECRPISKEKYFRLSRVISRGGSVVEGKELDSNEIGESNVQDKEVEVKQEI